MSSLIGVMGFTEILRPKITFFLWEFFKKFIIFTLFKLMGFSGTPETETRLQENQTRKPTELIRKLLPVIEISEQSANAHAGSGEISGSCAVCLCEYLGGEEIRCLRTCEHVFHRSCLDRWMNRDQWTCPLCRTPITPPQISLLAVSVFVDQDSEDHGT
ncbi:brassinosteroid-responsive RING protein 1-like [Primulina eburnea]|uniref:brassinosteroid-responsive RING protein 1-like n=1 Tax=Primulina eburnea TaxID=1245227 RepID=UPI003C6BE608